VLVQLLSLWDFYKRHERDVVRKVIDRNIYFRKIVLERDNFECQICGDKNNLEAHHIISPRLSPMEVNDRDNGITLCRSCHKNIHKSIPGCGYQELRQCKAEEAR